MITRDPARSVPESPDSGQVRAARYAEEIQTSVCGTERELLGTGTVRTQSPTKPLHSRGAKAGGRLGLYSVEGCGLLLESQAETSDSEVTGQAGNDR